MKREDVSQLCYLAGFRFGRFPGGGAWTGRCACRGKPPTEKRGRETWHSKLGVVFTSEKVSQLWKSWRPGPPDTCSDLVFSCWRHGPACLNTGLAERGFCPAKGIHASFINSCAISTIVDWRLACEMTGRDSCIPQLPHRWCTFRDRRPWLWGPLAPILYQQTLPSIKARSSSWDFVLANGEHQPRIAECGDGRYSKSPSGWW